MQTIYKYQNETCDAVTCLSQIAGHTVSGHAMNLGLTQAEPLIICLDSLTRYAKAHAKRFDSPLSDDYVLGPQFLDALKGIRGLMDGDGAVAHERNITTDSKDNGTCENMFWKALELAGFTEETANL